MVDKRELTDIQRVFKCLDIDMDGKLSLQELTEGFNVHFNNSLSS